jgi:predicted nuclease of predicted toxin-antitoxin system
VRLKLDENLGVRTAEFIRSAGHDVTTVPSQNLYSSTDKDLLETCRVERRCLVTLDVEFGNPLLFRPSDYEGIAVLRLPSKPTPDDILRAIRTLTGGLSRKEIKGKLWIIQRGRIREYQPEDEEI